MKNMKKVLHVIEYFNVAGAENIVSVLAEKCNNSQFCHQVLALNEVGINGNRLQSKGINVQGMLCKEKKMGLLKIVLILKRFFRKQNINIIHVHNYTPWLFCVFATLFTSKKIVVTLHGMLENKHSVVKRMLIRFLVQHTDRIICVSKEIQQDILKVVDNLEEKTSLIINGINLDKFNISVDRNKIRKDLGVNPYDYLLVTVGRFYAIKNLERQIEMMSCLASLIPNVKLMIAARPVAYTDKIKVLAKRLNVMERVIFLGLRDDIPTVLKASDLFIMSSFSEGTSLALIEAMAARLPVVVSNVGGNPNLVQNGENGFLFDLEKAYDFENKVMQLYKNPELAKKFSNNQEKFIKKFSEQNMINSYKKVYKYISHQ